MVKTLDSHPPSSGQDALKAVPSWHCFSEEEVLARLETASVGLTTAEVEDRRAHYGENRLPGHQPLKLSTIFFHQFLNPLIYILLVAGGVSIAIGEHEDAVFIFIVIFLNAIIGTVQEWKAEQSVALLQGLLKTYAQVKRDHHTVQLDSTELVPGDWVLLESGHRVPADIRLLETNNLVVDESLLTGESLAVTKTFAPMEDAETPVSERTNIAFAGTTVVAGRAQGVVVATGTATEVGKIAHSVTTTGNTKTPLIIRMERFSTKIGYIVLAACALLALIAFYQGIPGQEVFMMAVALAVSAIPEGLPVAMTVVLSIATSRMSKRRVIVRKLMTVEGLGSCTYIASDKTGTLTLNKQTVKALVLANGKSYKVTGEGYAGDGTVTTSDGTPPSSDEQIQLEHLAKAVVLCNEGSLHRDEEDTWEHQGDPIDIALLALGYKLSQVPQQVKKRVDLVGEIPFESERMFAAVFYREDGALHVAVKGAMEAVLPHCAAMESATGEMDRDAVEAKVLELSSQGYRVILVADGQLEESAAQACLKSQTLPSLTFLGLVALIDPMRPEVKEAVHTCKRAGIKVAMVTGDHPATSLAIAKQLGIAESWENLITGAELSELGEPDHPQVLEKIKNTAVFSRVTPLQKLHIVEGLRRLGHFVAVTGDGVNDAPALKSANIGVAMGSGTDVAKDTASMIITDDNFASIVAGVEEGRFAYDNIRKVIYLLISTGAAEVILFILALLAGLPLPLLAVQLLWLNLVTNGLQHVGLAFEKGEADAIRRKPRDPDEDIFDRQMIQQTLMAGMTMGVIAFVAWYVLMQLGWSEFAARNWVLLLMVLLENVHVFNCRSEAHSAFSVPLKNNTLLLYAVLGAQGIHLLAMHVPVLQNILHLEPVSLTDWLYAALCASMILVASEIFKRIKARTKEA